MKSENHAVTFKLDKYHRGLLDKFADETGLSMTDIVKIALRELSKNSAALSVISVQPVKPAEQE